MCHCVLSDPPSCFSKKTRRAKKEHWCCECRRLIKPGEHYEYASGVWDGNPDSFKTCERCVRLRDVHVAAESAVGGDCLPVFGDLLQQIGECCREDREYLRAFRAKLKAPADASSSPATTDSASRPA